MMREHPERFPWTELSLSDPVGPFTGLKLASLGDDAGQCLGLLRSAGLAETPFEQPGPIEARCRFDDGVLLRPEDRRSISYSPRGVATSCPVAAATVVLGIV